RSRPRARGARRRRRGAARPPRGAPPGTSGSRRGRGSRRARRGTRRRSRPTTGGRRRRCRRRRRRSRRTRAAAATWSPPRRHPPRLSLGWAGRGATRRARRSDVRIGLLTGGGDVPGLNAVIRAVVKHGLGTDGHTIVGFRNGCGGVADGAVVQVGRQDIRNVLPVGGTLLGTDRYHPHRHEGGLEAVLATLEAERIDAVICVGGDGT